MKYRCSGRLRKHRDGTAYCDYEAGEPWKGMCPGCGRPYSILKERPQEDMNKFSLATLANIKPPERLSTGIKEMDYVLNGGLVPGSTLVITGPPGCGKTTVLLQTSNAIATKTGRPVMISSGEQSDTDLGIFASRLKLNSSLVQIRGNQGDMYKITSEAERIKPALLIVDSAQTAFISDVGGDVGSSEQLKAVANWGTSFGKVENISIVMVVHFTKESEMAGPRMLEHLVDSILFLDKYYPPEDENDDDDDDDEMPKLDEEYIDHLREFEIGKNRFGPPGRRAVVEMTETGLQTPSRPIGKRIIIP